MTTSRTDRGEDLAERVRPLLVPAQVVAFTALLAPGGARVAPPPAVRAVGAVVTATGAAMAISGAVSLGRDLTPFVDLRPGARLVTGGVYGLSRHPVYTGLLTAAAGWTALRGHRRGAVATIVLAVIFHLKAGLEERRLRQVFGGEYEAYARRVPRLVGLPK